MPQPAKPQNSRPGSTPLSRRRLLAGAGGAVAAGALFSRAGFASAAGRSGRRRARWFATSAADKPTLSQWYHGYGEEGVEDAVQPLRRRLPRRQRRGRSGSRPTTTTTVAAALLTDDGPDVFEFGNGPNIDMITDRPGAAARRHPRRRRVRLQRAADQAAHLRRPPVGGAADHRHALPRLPQELLADAGIEPPATVDDLIAAAAELTTGDHSRAVPRQRRWRRHARRHGRCGRPAPTTSPTTTSSASPTTTCTPRSPSSTSCTRATRCCSARRPTGATPEPFINELTADPAHRAVDVPGDLRRRRSATTST